jgi:hypothetical protein
MKCSLVSNHFKFLIYIWKRHTANKQFWTYNFFVVLPMCFLCGTICLMSNRNQPQLLFYIFYSLKVVGRQKRS